MPTIWVPTKQGPKVFGTPLKHSQRPVTEVALQRNDYEDPSIQFVTMARYEPIRTSILVSEAVIRDL